MTEHGTVDSHPLHEGAQTLLCDFGSARFTVNVC